MKQNFFLFAFASMICSTTLAENKQVTNTLAKAAEVTDNSYFGTDKSGNQVNGNFDTWQDLHSDGVVVGYRPAWWETNAAYDNKWQVDFEKAEDRFGETDKAVKLTTTHGATWYTWHVHVRPCATVSQPDSWTFAIKNGDEFYYTFWAKGSVGGEVLYVGASEMYNNNVGGQWADMPNFTLTKEWKQYGIQVKALMEIKMFHIQPRKKCVVYFDDLVINQGTELPELNEEITTATDKIAYSSFQVNNKGKNTIAINTDTEGSANIFSITGELIQSIQITKNETLVTLQSAGLYIVQFADGQKSTSRKIIIR